MPCFLNLNIFFQDIRVGFMVTKLYVCVFLCVCLNACRSVG